MKEYQYSIIRRESRNPKRNREGRGISQSDLEALKQELEGNSQGIVSAIYDRDIALDSLTLTSTDISERLGAAEEALTGKLDSGDFSKWRTGDYANRQSALDNALAGKQPVGSYVDPSQLDASKQQAVAEAVERAEELDKKLKVGGRNLIRAGYFEKVYFRSDTDKLISYDDKDKKITYIGKASRWNSWVWLSDMEDVTTINLRKAIGEYTLSFSVRGRGTVSFEVVGNYKTNYSDYKTTVQTLTEDWQRVSCPFTRSAEDSSLFCLYNDKPETGDWVQFADDWKLERGTVATDWTPAPEDVAESVSKVSKSFEDLSTHPLTVDDNGFWKIWSVKDNKYVTTQYQSRGRDGQDGRNGSDGADGKDGHTPRIDWDGTKLIIENMAPVDLRGEAGHSPSPEEVLRAQGFEEMLDEAVWYEVKPVKDDLSTANTNITNLQKVALTQEMKTDLADLTDSLKVLRNTDGSFKEVALQRYIALSGNGKDISAYLASNALTAVLKAGITNFGTPQEREEVAINHNGTGHIGNLYFAGNQIDFRTDEHTDPYLSIGAEESQFIDDFLRTARLDDTPVSVSSVTLTTSTTSYERTVDVANDGTRLTVTIDSIKIETYGGAKTRLTLDGEVLAEWRGKEYKSHGGSLTGGDIEITQEPYTASDLYYERGVKAGRHTLRLEIAQPTDGATATVRGLRVRRRYDTGRQQSALTKSGLRLFGSPDRYLDVDYRKEYYNGPNNDGYMVGWIDNDYTVRIKGGAKVDKLTADELDMPGVPLCGATFDEGGGQINSFGAKAKQQGYPYAQAYRAYNADFYRVYHSIGHKNYIPVLQVYGLSNGNYSQCLTTRIDAIEANSFAVRIVTSGNLSIKHSFSYVAFKTTE